MLALSTRLLRDVNSDVTPAINHASAARHLKPLPTDGLETPAHDDQAWFTAYRTVCVVMVTQKRNEQGY